MAFEIIDIVETKGTATGVAASLSKMRKAPALLRFSFKPAVFDELGFAEGDRFVVLLGTGEDFGIVRLQKNKAGKAKAVRREVARGAYYFSISLRHRHEFVDRTEKSSDCQWEKIDLTTIEIVLPAWADETNPERKKRIASVPASVAAGQREADRLRREQEEAEERRRQSDARDEEKEKKRLASEILDNSEPEFRASLGVTPLQREFLKLLVAKAGKTVSRDSAMMFLYPDGNYPADDKIIDVMLSHLRKKLPASVTIETIWGGGWKITGDVSSLYEQEGK